MKLLSTYHSLLLLRSGTLSSAANGFLFINVQCSAPSFVFKEKSCLNEMNTLCGQMSLKSRESSTLARRQFIDSNASLHLPRTVDAIFNESTLEAVLMQVPEYLVIQEKQHRQGKIIVEYVLYLIIIEIKEQENFCGGQLALKMEIFKILHPGFAVRYHNWAVTLN